jgi:hypothetical protein
MFLLFLSSEFIQLLLRTLRLLLLPLLLNQLSSRTPLRSLTLLLLLLLLPLLLPHLQRLRCLQKQKNTLVNCPKILL